MDLCLRKKRSMPLSAPSKVISSEPKRTCLAEFLEQNDDSEEIGKGNSPILHSSRSSPFSRLVASSIKSFKIWKRLVSCSSTKKGRELNCATNRINPMFSPGFSSDGRTSNYIQNEECSPLDIAHHDQAQGQLPTLANYDGDSMPMDREAYRGSSLPGSLKELSFYLGLGFATTFLLMKNRSDFDKMFEMHAQMENLLTKMKNLMGQKNTNNFGSDHPEADVQEGYSASCCQDVPDDKPLLSSQNSGSSDGSHVSYSSPNNFPDYNGTFKNIEDLEEDRLKTELEAELERLQLDTDDVSELSENYVTEGPLRDFTANDPFEIHNQESCGVPPLELERKLHELLESRLKERISILESALETTEIKLDEKEMEVLRLERIIYLSRYNL